MLLGEHVQQYLALQYAKGLVLRYSTSPLTNLLPGELFAEYHTHWGTHRNVIRPEIIRLTAQYGVCPSVEARTQDGQGNWTIVTAVENNSTCVSVTYSVE